MYVCASVHMSGLLQGTGVCAVIYVFVVCVRACVFWEGGNALM